MVWCLSPPSWMTLLTYNFQICQWLYHNYSSLPSRFRWGLFSFCLHLGPSGWCPRSFLWHSGGTCKTRCRKVRQYGYPSFRWCVFLWPSHVHETNVDKFVEDAPTALWFTYCYVHSPATRVAIQRVRLNQSIKLEQIAHLTNHIFTQGYLPGLYRPLVYWETQCGEKLTEDANIIEALAHGFGTTEGKAIKLVVGELHNASIAM